MGARRAVAAKLASVIVFTTILIANEVVFESENEFLVSASLAGLERAEKVNAAIAGASVVFDALVSLQTQLEANPLRCEHLREQVGSMMASSNQTTTTGQITISAAATLRPVEEGPAPDNRSMLGPFSGFARGSLNLVVDLSLRASGPKGLPSYAAVEVRYVHLPIHLDKAIALCRSLAAQSGCGGDWTPSGLYAEGSGATGLSGHCGAVRHRVTLMQESVEGVGGPFSWRVVGWSPPP